MADLASVTAGLIEKVQIGSSGTAHSIASTAYGECNTPAATQVKTVNMTGFQLIKGVTVHIKFTYGNSASAVPKLDVNGTGAKDIKLYGTTDAGTIDETTGWQPGAVVSFTYDGTNWLRDQGYNTNTTYTIKDTYSDTDGNPISGKGVKAALETLDVSNITDNLSASKTITALSETDGKIAATASNIQIAESQVTNLTTDLGNKMPKSGGTFTGNVDFSSEKTLTVNTPTADGHAATKKYVDDKTAALTGALHLIGSTSTVITDGDTTSTLTPKTTGSLSKTTGFEAGDVVLYSDKEFVWTGAAWELLGEEGSYALKSSKDKAIKTLGFTQGTLPTLGDAISVGSASGWNAGSTPTLGDPISVGSASGWSAGAMTSAEVTNGTLLITIGSAPSLTVTSKSIPNVTGVGSTPSLTVTSKSIPNVTGVGTLPSVNPTSIDVVVP